MKEFFKHHKGSAIFTVVTMILGFAYGMYLFGDISKALGVVFIMAVLSILEVSLSIDNAIVNAKVLKDMEEKWQKRFLTWGMIIAVFFMRLVFPILIVSMAGGIGMDDAVMLAINDQDKYSEVLMSSHIMIAGFGGAFLALVALDYFFDVEKDVHWVHFIEEKLSKLGERKSISIVITLLFMYWFYTMLPAESAVEFFIAGIFGIITHELVKLFGDLMQASHDKLEATRVNSISATGIIAKTGLASFIYLEVLDASFSLDSVIGALVISKDIFIIMGGLAVGAMFVRSLTLQLVQNGTLSEYKYLEHAAFYAILALAVIMFLSTMTHISEIISALLPVTILGIGLYHSFIVNKRDL